jgi:hypothetical protein
MSFPPPPPPPPPQQRQQQSRNQFPPPPPQNPRQQQQQQQQQSFQGRPPPPPPPPQQHSQNQFLPPPPPPQNLQSVGSNVPPHHSHPGNYGQQHQQQTIQTRPPPPPAPMIPPPPNPPSLPGHAHTNYNQQHQQQQQHQHQGNHNINNIQQQQQQQQQPVYTSQQSAHQYPQNNSHQQQQQQKQQPPSCPPLFTRPQVDGEINIDAPLPMYYPKGCWSNDNPDQNELPPAADSRFISLDDGNAAPDFIRSTMYRIPSDRHILRSATGDSEDTNHKHDYMGLLCTPLAFPSSDHPPPPSDFVLGSNNIERALLPDSGALGRVPVDYTTNRDAPPRCSRCYAYVNPYWTISKCNFCGRSSNSFGQGSSGSTQSQYGEKVGTVDYPVQGPYITRTSSGPVRPNWIFCVDLTCPKVIDYIDLILDEIWPAFYHNIVMAHIETTQGQHGRPVVLPRVAMAFVCSTGIYIPQKSQIREDEMVPLSQDGFIVMPDVAHDEAFSPLPLSEWSWSFPDEYEDLLSLWNTRIRPVLLPQLIRDRVKNYHKNPSSTSHSERKGGYSMSAGGAALEFLVDALEESGGRAVLWTWRRPNYGLGALVDRERVSGGNNNSHRSSSSNIGGTSLYMPLQDSITNPKVQKDPNLKAAADFYTQLGKRCVKAKVALDIVLHTNPDVTQSFLDVATLGSLCEISGGRLIWIDKVSYESTEVWKKAIHEELMRPLYLSGWDVIFKVRCSQGLQIRSIVSSVGSLRTSSSIGQDDELELSVVTPETCLGVTLEHRIGGLPTPKDNKFAFVQTALLYTNPWTGDRRIRISTLAIRVTSEPKQVLPAMDFGALAALQLRMNFPHSNYSSSSKFSLDGISATFDASSPDQKGDNLLTDARHDMFTACRQVLVAHRKLVSKYQTPPIGQLLIPESLQLWPLFVMSAAKSPLLRPSVPRRGTGTQSAVPSPRGDERAYYIYHARKVCPSSSMLLVNPLLFDLGESLGLYDERPLGQAGREIATYQWKKLREPGSSILDPMANLKNSPVVDLPSPLPATVSNLAEDGIYLLDTCFVVFVLIEQGVDDDQILNEDLQSKIHTAVQQFQLWSQVAREPTCLRPTASLPVVMVRQKTDVAQYQALLRWMVLDATSHDKDFGTFCTSLQQQIYKRI